MRRRVYLPIELRRQIVEPAVLQPILRVGVDLIVRIEADYAGRVARTPYAKRANTELYQRFDRLDTIVHVPHQAVDVVAAPIGQSQLASRAHVLTVELRVWKRDRTVRIRVKVVVNMDSVYVITSHDVVHNRQNVILN